MHPNKIAKIFPAEPSALQLNQKIFTDGQGKRLPPWLIAAQFLPILLIGLFIVFKVTDVLLWDEWDAVGYFWLRVHEQGFSWSLFWEPHADHRLFLPRLLEWLNSEISFSVYRPIFLANIFFFLTYLIVFRWTLSSIKLEKRSMWLFIFIPLFFFHWGQRQNFFTGLQIVWALQGVGSFLCIDAILRKKWLWAFGGFLVTYLSFGSWIVLVPVLLVIEGSRLLQAESKQARRTSLLRLLCQIVFFGFLTWFYYHDFQEYNRHSPILEAMNRPLDLFYLYIGILGGPFAILGNDAARFFGIIFLLSSFIFWRKGLLRNQPFYFYTILYAMIMIFTVAFGRLSYWQFNNIIAGRYSAFIMPAWIAIILIYTELLKNKNILRYLFIFFMFVNVIVLDAKNHKDENWLQFLQNREKTCLIDSVKKDQVPSQECVEHLYPEPSKLFSYAKKMVTAQVPRD